MLRHGRAGVPMEVMGLMLGEFVDDYTVRVVDVFAMPQSGTGVSVEAVDPVFQTKMMDMLRQTGRYPSSPRHLLKASMSDSLQTGNSSRLVPLTSRVRLLALIRRHQHATIVRTTHPPRRRRRRRSHSIRQRQSRHRCLPPHKPANTHDGPRTATNNLQSRSSQQTIHPSADPRPE